MPKKNPSDKKWFKRRNQRLEPLTRILIITEGTNSEPSYFKKLFDDLSIPTVRVEIISSKQSTPESVVAKLKEVLKDGSEFEFIFCVFDRDSHPAYTSSVKEIARFDERNTFGKIVATPSIPCFEFWYLLHANQSTKPYGVIGSPCDSVVNDLKQVPYFASYSKSDCEGIYDELSSRMNTAISNAKSGIKLAKQNGYQLYHEDPSSRIYLVVEKLLELKEKVIS